jgi:hypothetical protein
MFSTFVYVLGAGSARDKAVPIDPFHAYPLKNTYIVDNAGRRSPM